jgi:tetratricopeptide (TPR) repeat protein
MTSSIFARRCVSGIAAGLISFVPVLATAADTAPEALPEPAAVASKTDRMAVARQAINAKDWQKSIAELTLQAKEKPGNADTYNLLAYSLRKQATPDLPKAFEYYRLALKADPKHKGAHEYIGEAYLMDKQPAKAEEHLASLKTICGNTTCEQYQDLAKSIAAYKAKKS